ncbi:MAG: tRNA (N6-isopentenyl adenosine(37)-C2)-methylthiotransferase MiaB [Candidatus Omnitrophica bacterium]|nr:tRNA (N6-isopentenyl adenosine(37)-C2)-methylthiotransferase MiaB [Candidatus Omnitrophota bacterium]
MENNELKNKKVHLKTYGCQMNTRDSEVIAGLLQKAGYKITEDEAGADIIIFNTCSVRQHAEEKVWSEIGRIAKVRRCKSTLAGGVPNSKPIIGLVGCMAQNYKEAAFERSADVDFVVGPADIAKIPEIISQLSAVSFQLSAKGEKLKAKSIFERKIWETDGENRPEEIYHTGFFEDKNHAFIVISEGCSNFCSYCVVPYTRGALRHRRKEDVLKEINEAVALGITSVTLLGQNVNSYQPSAISHQPSANFIDLIHEVNTIKGLKEFGFITSHPKDTSVELFKAMAECEKLKKCLHLPIQSGSDRILKLMNRNYTAKSYIALAEDYRKIVKGGTITTDIIVGFPTEAEKDFQATFDLVEMLKFDAAYIFKYSPRPHTEAAKWPDDVVKEEKERRHRLILDLQKKISKALNSNDKIQNSK